VFNAGYSILLLPLKCQDVAQVQSESDLMLARASPSGFPVSYHFSISLTYGFAFSAETYFHVVYARHLALRRLKMFYHFYQQVSSFSFC